VIYGILRTLDAVSPVPADALLSSLIGFICIYALFLTAFVLFALRMIRRSPQGAPAWAETSGSLKQALKPRVMNAPVGGSPVPAE
jgi:cytochrome d ubiquinol oxidase subunit I